MKPNRRHDRIWKRLATWYGARWAEQYGAEMPEDWRVLVDSVDDARLEQALLTARRVSPLHPITLGLLENSLPPKQRVTRMNVGEELVMHATSKAQPCKHQLAQSWPFFGSEHGINGLTIPACSPCEKPSQRFLAKDLLG